MLRLFALETIIERQIDGTMAGVVVQHSRPLISDPPGSRSFARASSNWRGPRTLTRTSLRARNFWRTTSPRARLPGVRCLQISARRPEASSRSAPRKGGPRCSGSNSSQERISPVSISSIMKMRAVLTATSPPMARGCARSSVPRSRRSAACAKRTRCSISSMSTAAISATT